jgi:hypothetical protein
MPGFGALVRGVIQLWTSSWLLWVILLAIPHVALVPFLPSGPEHRPLAMGAWVAAFGLGAALGLLVMGEQWVNGRVRHLLRSPPGRRLALTVLFALGYALVGVAPWVMLLAVQTSLPPEIIIPGVLLLTTPFQALLAPALTAAATQGKGALGPALRIAGRRTWLHLGILLAVGAGLGGIVGIVGWSFAATMKGGGEVVTRMMQIAGVAAGESLWVALTTVCGMDALSTAPPPVAEQSPAAVRG